MRFYGFHVTDDDDDVVFWLLAPISEDNQSRSIKWLPSPS
jgi:hypothetical protein